MSRSSERQEFGREDMDFLSDLSAAVVEASRVRPGERVTADTPANQTGGTLIRPGGRDCYPAFWIRDHARSVESGLIGLDEQRHAMILTARAQQEGDRALPTGSLVPHGSIADHVNFDGTPIFFAGTYDPDLQGGLWGKRPCFDDHFYFIDMAWSYVHWGGEAAILESEVQGRRLIDRLDMAFTVPPCDSATGLVCCDETNWGVSDGYTDSVLHIGKQVYSSLLKRKAAAQLAQLHERLGQPDRSSEYRRIDEDIRRSIPRVFTTSVGLLAACTGTSAQPCVWASAFAIYSGAVDGPAAGEISRVLGESYRQGFLAWRGNIRHVRTCDDYDENTIWERLNVPQRKNTYQNGAYWGTPTGWVAYAIAQTDEGLARRLAAEYVEELREGDFRKGPEYGSPWECLHPDGGFRQNPVYMTSVTSPLAAFRRMGW